MENRIREVKRNEALRKNRRNPEDITLIAVSKTKPISMIEEAYNLGIDNLVKIRFELTKSMMSYMKDTAMQLNGIR